MGKIDVMSAERLQNLKGFVFDLDGTLALTEKGKDGFRLLPGARELLDTLNHYEVPFVVFTNGTFFPVEHYIEKLAVAGIEIRPEQMLTPSNVAAQSLLEQGCQKILVLGGKGVSKALVDVGLTVLDPRTDNTMIPDAVYVGWHPELIWDDIERACHAIWQGAGFYVASMARFFASKSGKRVGISAAIAAAISNTTEHDPILVGKPSLKALQYCSDKLGGIAFQDIAVVGDDPVLEPALAHSGGACSIATLTGLGNRQDFSNLPDERAPHLLVNDMMDLLQRYQGQQQNQNTGNRMS